jgi:hypothetical protein
MLLYKGTYRDTEKLKDMCEHFLGSEPGKQDSSKVRFLEEWCLLGCYAMWLL